MRELPGNGIVYYNGTYVIKCGPTKLVPITYLETNGLEVEKPELENLENEENSKDGN